MYHIKDDKRARNTAEMIYKGLMDCLKLKPFNKITISDIQKSSTVGRATFYRHFDSISDVLYMKCDQCFKDVLMSYNPLEDNRNSLLLHFFSYWCNNSEVIELLIQINRMDIIYDCHLRNSGIITQQFLSDIDTTSEDYIYFMSLRTSILIGYLKVWIETGRRKTPQEIVDTINKQLSITQSSDIVL